MHLSYQSRNIFVHVCLHPLRLLHLWAHVLVATRRVIVDPRFCRHPMVFLVVPDCPPPGCLLIGPRGLPYLKAVDFPDVGGGL